LVKLAPAIDGVVHLRRVQLLLDVRVDNTGNPGHFLLKQCGDPLIVPGGRVAGPARRSGLERRNSELDLRQRHDGRSKAPAG